jgi:hypothetical protein
VDVAITQPNHLFGITSLTFERYPISNSSAIVASQYFMRDIREKGIGGIRINAIPRIDVMNINKLATLYGLVLTLTFTVEKLPWIEL